MELEVYDYHTSLRESTKYFNGDKLAAKVFLDKYALRDNKQNILEDSPEKMHIRIAKELARIEKKKFKEPMSFEEIFSYLEGFKKIVPQGSLMYGVGNSYQFVTLSNCYVCESPLDSYSSILYIDQQIVQISKRRGGVGIDISNLRPDGAPTTNAARTSTGVVSFMKRYSNSIREVGQQGRRGALIITIDIHHPEVLKFAKAKRNLTEITGANISIRLTNEFLESVNKNKDYEMRWPVDSKKPKISRMVNARDVWRQIVEEAHACLRGDTKTMIFVDDTIKVINMFDLFHFVRENQSKTIKILSLNLETNNLQWKKIISSQEYPLSKKIHCIKVNHGKSIYLTSDHIVYRINEYGETEAIEAKNIREGDKIVSAKHNGNPEKFTDIIDLSKYLSFFSGNGNYLTGSGVEKLLSKEEIINLLGFYDSNKCKRATNLKIQGCIPVKDILLINDIYNIQFDEFKFSPARQPNLNLDMKFEITKDLSFLMGLWLAEGTLHNNGLRFHINSDEIKYYKSFFDNVSKKIQCKYQIEAEGRYTCIFFNSTFLSRLFIGLGLLDCNRKKCIPDFIFNLSKEKTGAFITGFFSGDATTPSENISSVEISQSNLPLLENLRALLRQYNIMCSLHKNSSKGNKIICEKMCKTKNSYRLRVFSQFIKEFSELLINCEIPKIKIIKNKSVGKIDAMGVPYEINEKLFNKVFKSTKGREYISHRIIYKNSLLKNDDKINSFLSSDINFEKVISNEECICDEKFVYDITVEDNHTFVLLNGIVVSNCAEPGILFWDKITSESPADCYAEYGFKTLSTNPCSEIPLSNLDSCRLLLINLFGYVIDPFTKEARFDFEQLYKDAQIAQRFMDDIIDLEIECIDRIIEKVNKDPEPEHIKAIELSLWEKIREVCEIGRRTGTGTTGLGDTLASLGIPYCSKKGIETAEKIYKMMKLGCYRSSVEIAKELGPFKVWDYDLEKKNPFLLRIKEEDPELYKDMKQYGRRNIGLLTSAPAGSVSLLTQTTSGIEPLFRMEYKRRKKINPSDKNARVDFVDQNGDAWEEFVVYHPKVKMWMDITGETDLTKSPWYGSCAEEIDWKKRIEMQAAAGKNICHSISSCITSDSLIETNIGLMYFDELTDLNNIPTNKFEKENRDIYVTNYKMEVVKLDEYYNNGEKHILNMELLDGLRISCTANEKFIVLDDETGLEKWIEISEIKKGDRIKIKNVDTLTLVE